MQPPEMPAAPAFPPPPGVEQETPKRPRKNAIILGAAIGLLIIAGVATLAIIGGEDGPYPDSLDGLERIRSSAADTFEEGLAAFETAGISLERRDVRRLGSGRAHHRADRGPGGAELHATVGDPTMPAGDGVMCAWKATRIGFVIDFRTLDARSAIEVTVRVAEVIDAA
jgi:hypothetical protein